jgi:proline iminopeptidase
MKQIAWILLLVSCQAPAYIPGNPGVVEPAVQEGEFFLTEDGMKLYSFSEGSGQTVLVIPGGPGFAPERPWPALSALKDEFQFIYLHQRGSGYSTRPVDRFESNSWPKNMERLVGLLGMENHIQDIERIRLSLGLEKISMIGHSYGGFISALYAAEYPEHVQNLVLIAPAAVVRMPNDAKSLFAVIEDVLPESELEAYEQWRDEYFDFGNIWKKSEQDWVDLNNAMAPYFLKAAQSLQSSNNWGSVSEEDPQLTGGWIQQAVYMSMGRKYDMTEFLGRIKAKTTVFWGTEDLAASGAMDYVEAIGPAVNITLKNAGHFPQGHADKFSALLQRALY